MLFFTTIFIMNAQTDSIYNLQASIVNDTLKATFYSTFDRANFLELDVFVKNPSTDHVYVKYAAQNNNAGNTLISQQGTFTFVPVNNDVQKFTVNIKLDSTTLSNPLLISFFTWGHNYKSQTLNFKP